MSPATLSGRGDPIGWPALAVIAASFVVFMIALFAARRRTGAEPPDNATRSRRSMGGIVIQGCGIGICTYGQQVISLPPLSTPALLQAAVCALLMTGAIGLFYWASRTMGRNWSLVARTREDHQLVDGGPFAHVRHPIYLGMFFLMLALALALGHTGRLVLAIPVFALGTWLRISEEERLLRAMFGADYDSYAARVARFVPGVF